MYSIRIIKLATDFESSTYTYLKDNGDVSIDVVTACPLGNGIHQMQRSGVGTVITSSGTVLINQKCCWQCKNCLTVMITSDDPTAWNGKVGYYTERGFYEPVSMYFTYIEVPDGKVLPYHGSKILSGYRFFNR